jgi:hypothetical protein
VLLMFNQTLLSEHHSCSIAQAVDRYSRLRRGNLPLRHPIIDSYLASSTWCERQSCVGDVVQPDARYQSITGREPLDLDSFLKHRMKKTCAFGKVTDCSNRPQDRKRQNSHGIKMNHSFDSYAWKAVSRHEVSPLLN